MIHFFADRFRSISPEPPERQATPGTDRRSVRQQGRARAVQPRPHSRRAGRRALQEAGQAGRRAPEGVPQALRQDQAQDRRPRQRVLFVAGRPAVPAKEGKQRQGQGPGRGQVCQVRQGDGASGRAGGQGRLGGQQRGRAGAERYAACAVDEGQAQVEGCVWGTERVPHSSEDFECHRL